MSLIKPLFRSVLVLSLFVAGAASAADITGRASSATEGSPHAEILEMLERYLAAYESGDVDQLRPFYDDDSMIWANMKPVAVGWPAIREMFAPSFEAYDIEADMDLMEVRVLGPNHAFLRFLTKVRITSKSDGKLIELTFRDFALFEETAAGWVVRRNIDQPTSMDLPHE